MLKIFDHFPEHNTDLAIQGPAGILQAHIGVPKENSVCATAIVCHPHPLMSGTMNNKVVTTTARAFTEMGLRSVRFNFRGVGQSEGSFAEGIGETEDLIAVINWIKQFRPKDQIWLAGFSFGSYVALRAANEFQVSQLLSIAPPVHYEGFKTIKPPNCPWLVIQGEEDEVVAPEEVYQWLAQFSSEVELIRFPNTGHFFHGKLINLRDRLIEHYRPAVKKLLPC